MPSLIELRSSAELTWTTAELTNQEFGLITLALSGLLRDPKEIAMAHDLSVRLLKERERSLHQYLEWSTEALKRAVAERDSASVFNDATKKDGDSSVIKNGNNAGKSGALGRKDLS